MGSPQVAIKDMPAAGDTFTTHARYMCVVNALDAPYAYYIVNLDNGNIEFWTSDAVEFRDMWQEFKV